MSVKRAKIKPLTKKQREIMNFVVSFYRQKGYSPSLGEIAEEFDLKAVSTVHKHLDFIKKKGYLRKNAFISRGISPLERSKTTIQVPLLGNIAAGLPIELFEDPDAIEVPINMLNKNFNYYALKVKGDSMIEDDVWDGDIILIKHQTIANIGEMIVAVVKDNVTLKRFGGLKQGMVELIPRNPRLTPFYVNPAEFEVRGKFAGLIRRASS